MKFDQVIVSPTNMRCYRAVKLLITSQVKSHQTLVKKLFRYTDLHHELQFIFRQNDFKDILILRAEKEVSKMFYQVDCNDENRKWKKHQKFDQTVQLQRGEKLAGRIEPRTIDLSEDLNWNHFKIKNFKWRRKEGLFDDMFYS